MINVIPSQSEKCTGAMLSTAIGDALGWPNELQSKNVSKTTQVADHFVTWTRRNRKPRWHDERIHPGEYSDDTQMTLCVARSILTGNWEGFFSQVELPYWLQYERGGGRALLRAARIAEKGNVPVWQFGSINDYLNAGGNGAVMRILPHVIAFAKEKNIPALMSDVVKNTSITHGHPRAFLGATCYAYALDYLLRKNERLAFGELVSAVIEGVQEWGEKKLLNTLDNGLNETLHVCDYKYWEEWDSTCLRMINRFEYIKEILNKGILTNDKKVLTDLGCFGNAMGAGDVAALASVYLASKYANNPTLGIIVPASTLGIDTDTIASITGGLLGMLSGIDWIPAEWKSVQDYDCIVRTTELLLASNKRDAANAATKKAAQGYKDWKKTPIGRMRLLDIDKRPNGKNGYVLIKKWQTDLGQTIFTKSFEANTVSDVHPSISSEDRGARQMSIDELDIWGGQLDLPSNNQTDHKQSKLTKQNALPSKDKLYLQEQFSLDDSAINVLLVDSNFNKRVTIGKILKIIREIIKGEASIEQIAERYKVTQAMVDLLKRYVKIN